LITESKNDLHYVLFNSVCSNTDLVEKFSEPKSTVDEREKLEKLISVLKQAEKKLVSDPNLTTSRYDNVDIYDEMDQKNKEFLELTHNQLEHRKSFEGRPDNSLVANTNERVRRQPPPQANQGQNDNTFKNNESQFGGNNFSHFGGFQSQVPNQPQNQQQSQQQNQAPPQQNTFQKRDFTDFSNMPNNQAQARPAPSHQPNTRDRKQTEAPAKRNNLFGDS